MSRRPLAALLAATAALAGCASQPRVAVAPAPAPLVAVEPVAPAGPSPINAGLSPAATTWHVRAALNVAALACRGADADTIVANYNALLTEQKVTLAAAQTGLAGEFKAGGGAKWQAAYDDAMTRLYNFFSQAQARDAFCQAAAQVLADARQVQPGGFDGFAAERLAALDRPFAAMLAPAPTPQPVIALAAATPVAPAAGPAPLLQLDLTHLSQ